MSRETRGYGGILVDGGRYRLSPVVDLQKRERANKRSKKVQRLDKGSCEQLCNELLVLCGYQVREWMLHDEMCCRVLRNY